MRILFGLTVAILLGATSGQAQAPPNLSGTWVLDLAESTFGMLPAPDQRTDVIEHREPRLVIRRMTTVQGQEATVELTYAVDGEPHRNSAGGADLASRLRWDGNVLVMISTVSGPQGEVTVTDRYALSTDGRTLIQERSLEAEGQAFQQRMVLRKQ